MRLWFEEEQMTLEGTTTDKGQKHLQAYPKRTSPYSLIPNFTSHPYTYFLRYINLATPAAPSCPQYGSPTEHVSVYIDTHLQPFVKSLPSHVQDTNHFFHMIWSLPTWHHHGHCWCLLPLHQHPPYPRPLCPGTFPGPMPSPHPPPARFLLQLTQFILTHNNFSFNSRHFLHTHAHTHTRACTSSHRLTHSLSQSLTHSLTHSLTLSLSLSLFDTILPTKDHRTTPLSHHTIPYPHPISPQAATQQGSSSTSIRRDWRSVIPAQNSCLAKLVSTLYSGQVKTAYYVAYWINE